MAAGRYRGIELDNSSRRSIVLRDASTSIESAGGTKTAVGISHRKLSSTIFTTTGRVLDRRDSNGRASKAFLANRSIFLSRETRKGPEGPEIRYRKVWVTTKTVVLF